MNKFEQLGLESLLKAILDLGFENPTEVGESDSLLEKTQIWLRWLRQGQENGSIWISVIQKIDANRNTQALILSPTRELCLQITNEIKTTRNTKRY
jgi:ATP-dependent RNA helicase DeaD